LFLTFLHLMKTEFFGNGSHSAVCTMSVSGTQIWWHSPFFSWEFDQHEKNVFSFVPIAWGQPFQASQHWSFSINLADMHDSMRLSNCCWFFCCSPNISHPWITKTMTCFLCHQKNITNLHHTHATMFSFHWTDSSAFPISWSCCVFVNGNMGCLFSSLCQWF